MLGIIDPEKGTLRLSRLVTVNTVLLLLITGLTLGNLIPLYPWATIGYSLIWIGNILVVWRTFRRRPIVSESTVQVPKILWLVPLPFTAAAIAAIVALVKKPDLLLAAQTVFMVLLSGYIWFLLFRLSRHKKAG